MKHVHKFETISHHGISSELMEHGFQNAEIRRCTVCNKETIFLFTKKGEEVQIFDESEINKEDILLA